MKPVLLLVCIFFSFSHAQFDENSFENLLFDSKEGNSELLKYAKFDENSFQNLLFDSKEGQSDLLKHMLHKANHYNFIRDHIKQIENLFTENFKDFEFDYFDYLTEDEPVLEEEDELLQWVYETDPTVKICEDYNNTYPFCPDGYYKFLLYSFLEVANNESNEITASQAVRLFGSITPIFGLNYTYLGDQPSGCSLSSWTYLSKLFGGLLGGGLDFSDPEKMWPYSMLDSTGKIPDGIFAGSRDMCDYLDEAKFYADLQGYDFPITCDSIIQGQSLSFLRGRVPIPLGNTKAWGSMEGCIGTKATFKPEEDPFYELLPGFAGLWTIKKFQVNMDNSSDPERALVLQNKTQPKVAPAFGLIPTILPEWLEFIWNAFVSNNIKDMLKAIAYIYIEGMDLQFSMCIPETCQDMEDRSNSILYKDLSLMTVSGGNVFGYTTKMSQMLVDNRFIQNADYDVMQPPGPDNPAYLTIHECTAGEFLCENFVVKDTYSIGIIALFSIIAFLMLLGTLVDVWQQINPYPTLAITEDDTKENIVVSMLKCFSININGKSILKTEMGKGAITCLSGMRFISMAWIILGHLYMYIAPPYGVVENPKFLQDAQNGKEGWGYEVLQNALPAVDTFFFMSGLLVCYLTLIAMEKGRFNIVLFYVHRIIRLTIPLGLAIAFVSAIPQYLGYGPLFFFNSGYICKEYGWRTLLYINNFYPTTEGCLGQTWYLACDMQMYIVSPILIYPLFKEWKIWKVNIGYALAAVTYITLTFYMGYVTVYYTMGPEQGFAKHVLVDRFDEMQDYYEKPWFRFQPYLIGMLLGYILFKTKNKEIKIPHGFNVVMWQTAFIVGMLVIFGLANIRKNNSYIEESWSVFEAVMYRCFSKTAWSLALSWVVFSCHHGYGGIINSFLSWDAFVPLSKLTYSAYLNHMQILTLIIFQFTTPVYVTNLLMSQFYIGIMLFVFGTSFVQSLSTELPFGKLEAIIVGAIMKIGSKGSKPKEKTTNLQGPTATNTKLSKEEEAEKSKENPKQQVDEKVGFSSDEIAEKMEDLIKPKVDQNGAILDPQVPPKYEEIVDESQKENSDKSSDTVVLADIHVSE